MYLADLWASGLTPDLRSKSAAVRKRPRWSPTPGATDPEKEKVMRKGMVVVIKGSRPRDRRGLRVLAECQCLPWCNQRVHRSAGVYQHKVLCVKNGDPCLCCFRIRGSAATGNGARGTLSVFRHLPSSLQTEKSVPTLDGWSPLDAPRNDVPPLAVFCQGFQELQVLSLCPGIATYQIHAQLSFERKSLRR